MLRAFSYVMAALIFGPTVVLALSLPFRSTGPEAAVVRLPDRARRITDAQVVEALKASGLPVKNIVVYSDATDPNKKRFAGNIVGQAVDTSPPLQVLHAIAGDPRIDYVGKISWQDARGDPTRRNADDDVTIEIFDTDDGAPARAAYLNGGIVNLGGGSATYVSPKLRALLHVVPGSIAAAQFIEYRRVLDALEKA